MVMRLREYYSYGSPTHVNNKFPFLPMTLFTHMIRTTNTLTVNNKPAVRTAAPLRATIIEIEATYDESPEREV
jgi:hypothetical protein